MKDAYIVSGFRSPVGKAKKGGLRFIRPDDLAAKVIKDLVKKTKGVSYSPPFLYEKRRNMAPR